MFHDTEVTLFTIEYAACGVTADLPDDYDFQYHDVNLLHQRNGPYDWPSNDNFLILHIKQTLM